MSEIKNKSIKDVIHYWDKNPVHSVEFGLTGDLRSYCEYIDELRWSDNEKLAREDFYELKGGGGARILDAGCGIGVFSRFYARKGSDFKVYAIDVASKAIEMTKKSFEIFGLNGEIRSGSVEDIPYSDDYFDYIVSNGVIHHTPDTEKAVSEFYRVLKPCGVASVCVYYRNFLLRPPFFNLAKLLLKLILKKTAGREMFFTAHTPEEFVRTYDGNDVPIAKVYTKREADELFSRFETLKVGLHYFPVRFLKGFKSGGIVHKMLDRYCGMLIYYLLRKPK